MLQIKSVSAGKLYFFLCFHMLVKCKKVLCDTIFVNTVFKICYLLRLLVGTHSHFRS
jgi:hypothetical protein